MICAIHQRIELLRRQNLMLLSTSNKLSINRLMDNCMPIRGAGSNYTVSSELLHELMGDVLCYGHGAERVSADPQPARSKPAGSMHQNIISREQPLQVIASLS